LEQHLGRPPLVHGPIPLGGLVKRELKVEHLAGVDPAIPDQLDQVG
jgi:hypothetical protein